MRNILGITAIESEELPDDIQHTKERKPDVLKKITDAQGATFVLHFRQWRVLAQLRNLGLTLKNTMNSIAKFISEERDVLYLRGFDKGEERIVKNLLTKLSWTGEEIADVAGVSVEFVKDVQQQLKDAK